MNPGDRVRLKGYGPGMAEGVVLAGPVEDMVMVDFGSDGVYAQRVEDCEVAS